MEYLLWFSLLRVELMTETVVCKLSSIEMRDEVK